MVADELAVPSIRVGTIESLAYPESTDMHATYFSCCDLLSVYETDGYLHCAFDPSVTGSRLVHELQCPLTTARRWLDKHYPGIKLVVVE